MDNVNDSLISSGFIPRYMLVKGETRYRERGRVPLEAIDMETNIKKVIEKLYQLCEYGGFDFVLTEEAKQLFNKIEQQLMKSKKYSVVRPFVGRYSQYLIVYADIIRLSKMITNTGFKQFTKFTAFTSFTSFTQFTNKKDSSMNNVNNENNVKHENDVSECFIPKKEKGFEEQNPHIPIVVSMRDILEAYLIIFPCLNFANEISQDVLENRTTRKVLRVLRKYRSVTHSKCLKYSRLDAFTFKKTINTLVERNQVDVKYDNDTDDPKPLSYTYTGD